MAMYEESKESPKNPKSENANPLFSPGFRSVAEMAGWDEEALLIASLVVEDTPDRNPKHRKRTGLLNNNTSPANSRRKRIAQRRSAAPISVAVLNLDEVQSEKKEDTDCIGTADCRKENEEPKAKDYSDTSSSARVAPISVTILNHGEVQCEKKEDTDCIGTADCRKENDEPKAKNYNTSSSISSEPPAIPCIDKLREELSCAICLEICFEPSTTPCGHSFCKKCLRSAADKCGKKCPKCRQLISNGRSCTVNTVLWNTIQLLFPQEIEARKAVVGSKDARQQTPARNHHNSRNRTVPVLNSLQRVSSRSERRQNGASLMSSRGDFIRLRSRRELRIQDEDAAFALRLQREEFMEAFSASHEQGRSSLVMATSNYRDSEEEQHRSSLAVARANLRAMASRAINVRTRSRGT